MPRRVSLPAADELFRNTGGTGVQPSAPQHTGGEGRTRASSGTRVPAPATGGQQPTEHATAEDPDSAGNPRNDIGGRPDAASRGGDSRAPRQTRPTGATGEQTGPAQSEARPGGAAGGGQGKTGQRRSRSPRRPSGRERHDEKITVYVSAEELMDLEHARLVLRGEHGLAVDRGRIVREAVAVVLADLESRGDASILVRRLRGR